jgi:hypothetical protein
VSQDVFRQLEVSLDLAKGIRTGPHLNNNVRTVTQMLDRKRQSLATGWLDVDHLASRRGNPVTNAISRGGQSFVAQIGSKNEGEIVVSHHDGSFLRDWPGRKVAGTSASFRADQKGRAYFEVDAGAITILNEYSRDIVAAHFILLGIIP